MKKFLYFLLGVLVAWIVFQLIYAYANHKSNDNLPSVMNIVEMSEDDANEVLKGYRRGQLEDVWGKADQINQIEDIWETEENGFLVVNYNAEDKVISCYVIEPEGGRSQ